MFAIGPGRHERVSRDWHNNCLTPSAAGQFPLKRHGPLHVMFSLCDQRADGRWYG
jgi:hypothetical protein